MTACLCYHELIALPRVVFFSQGTVAFLKIFRYIQYCIYFLRDVSHGRVLMYHEFIMNCLQGPKIFLIFMNMFLIYLCLIGGRQLVIESYLLEHVHNLHV